MIRSLRFNPPGYAGTGVRARIFDAALEQAEQLFRAAESAGPQSRPILLFYGLSQTGRALCAVATNVANKDVQLTGHGIGVEDLAVANNVPLADLVVQPHAGSFRQVAAALNASDYSGTARLGDLWAMLPDSDRFPLPGTTPNRPLILSETLVSGGRACFEVQPLPGGLQYRPDTPRLAAQGDENEWRAERQRVTAYLADYPLLNQFDFINSNGPAQLRLIGDGLLSVAVCWSIPPGENAKDVLDSHSVTYLGDALAFPRVGDSPHPAHPILLWWAILFTLSMLARYQPDAWAKYVNVSKNSAAVPVEDLLNRALNVLPETIHRAILQVSK